MDDKSLAVNQKEIELQLENILEKLIESKRSGKPAFVLIFTIDSDDIKQGASEKQELQMLRQNISYQVAISMLELGKQKLVSELLAEGKFS